MGRQGSTWLTLMAAALACGWAWTLSAQSSDKLVYADFEQVHDGRAVSARGGAMQLFGYSENTHRPPFRGAPAWTRRHPSWSESRPTTPIGSASSISSC